MLVVLAVAVAVTSCAADGPLASTSAGDCASRVRVDGAVFTGYGDARTRPTARVGTGDLADCDDLGVDPQGSVFADDPPQVAVWSVRGYPTDEVLAVRRGRNRVEVFVADSLPSRQRDRVLGELKRSDADTTGPARAGDEPITARALAAVVAEHTGEPRSARRGTDLEEVGKGLAAAVELRYPDPDDEQSDGHLLAVGVGTGFERVAADCRALLDQGMSGCEETDDGLLFWVEATPEEDPGAVHLLASKGETDVLLWYAGPPIDADPRELDLPVTVADLAAVAADPRVDVTTSEDAVEAGRDLAFWRDSPA